MHLNDRYAVPVLLLWLVVIGLFIRIWGLWNYGFSPDEVMLALVPVGDNLSQVWQSFKDQTNGPFMYGVIYCLMKISYSELVIRCMSLIPGALLIMMFFFLGRTVSGTISGLAMAYMAAFSSGEILVSQLIRPYSLLLFFLTGALWFFFSYFGTREKKYLYGYSLFAAFSLITHYPAVICLAAIVIVWLAHSIIQKKPPGEFANILIYNIPPFIIFGVLYLSQISDWIGGSKLDRFQSLINQTYYSVLFPQTLSGFIQNTYDLFQYLFLPPYGTWLMVLAGAGVVSLWRSSRRSLVVIIFSTFVINFALAFFKIYPFGESRHSIYLFPMVAVLAGAAVQSGYNCLMNNVIPFLSKTFSLKIESLRMQLLFLGITGILVSTFAIAFSYRQSDFLRRSEYTARYNEFPLKRAVLEKVFEYLTEHMRPNDIILTDIKTSFYFRYDQLPNQPHFITLSWYCSKIAWKGFNYFYIHKYSFDEIEVVIGTLRGIHQHVDLKNFSKVWLVNIGWGGDEIETLLSKKPEYRFLFHKELSAEAGCIYSVKTEDIIQNVPHAPVH